MHYLEASMAGTYWVECKVIKFYPDKASISYFDSYLNDYEELEVDYNRLRCSQAKVYYCEGKGYPCDIISEKGDYYKIVAITDGKAEFFETLKKSVIRS